jgi:hypothetical protein
MSYKTMTLAVTLGAALVVAGCGGESEMTRFEPGVYQGKPDPLVEQQASPEQQQRLRERAVTALTDR